MRRASLRIVLACAVLTAAPGVALADPEEDAAVAYDRGAAAYERGEHAIAARELARADQLAPNDVTLELALTAVARTDDAVLGMTLVERAESRPRAAKRLAAAADVARKRFAASVGKIDVVCAVDPPCEAAFDGTAIAPNRAAIVPVGAHRVTIARNGTRETHAVTIDAGKTVQLIATVAPPLASPATPPADNAEARGPRPVWFWVATGVTVAVSSVTALSALDTASTYDRFSADRSDVELSNAGRSAERRTVALGITSGVLAVGTVVLGVFFIDWRSSARAGRGPGAAGWTF